MSSTDGDVESSRSTRNTQRVQEQEPHRHQLAASRRKTDFSIDGLLSDSASYGRLARATSPGLVANAGGDSLTGCREREPSSSFEWLQCSRYRPPKLPRKFLVFVLSRSVHSTATRQMHARSLLRQRGQAWKLCPPMARTYIALGNTRRNECSVCLDVSCLLICCLRRVGILYVACVCACLPVGLAGCLSTYLEYLCLSACASACFMCVCVCLVVCVRAIVPESATVVSARLQHLL